MNNRKVISLDQNGEHYYRQGIKKRQQNLKKEALALLKKAYDKNPGNMDYLSEYVYVMAENGFGNEAEHLIIETFVKDNYDPEYFYILSQINIIKHDANKAFLYGVQYSNYDPESNYDDTLEEMFDVEIEDENELEKEAERFIGQQIFQHLFMNAKVSEALEYLDSLPMNIQEEPEFRNLKAMAYLFLNKFEDAQVLLEQLLEDDQTDMHALSHMTLLHYHTEQFDKYEAYLKKLEVVEPLDDDARFKVGLVLNFLQKYEHSYKLLFPLYKKQKIVNFQLLHALSFSSYHLGKHEESKIYWTRMQNFHPVDEKFSPWKKDEAAAEILKLESMYLHDEDQHKRLLALYLISKIEPREAIIGLSIWDHIETLDDYEKLYVTFLFQGLKLVRLGRMHIGLELLYEQSFRDEETLLMWINVFHDLYEKHKEFEDVESHTAAALYLYPSGRRLTKKGLAELFNTTVYRLNKAIDRIKQI
ncbi:hypothetical protein BN1048_00197 [Jeotgalicoccus saudimassiliensis]|uniref:Anaphase-promoting complex, cyclosome, subunit 3 n=1 Tax=Jeotgalicoccus saudimassiliensis TaxID=1461582 RepID=A0A078LV57_9STAP|nr:hypothetical protein [Jeotgalicoccus saudimassiliensis]CDZ99078.1 hypothetical protein BN1048_00197 [Jeotgalicoccus saudimassiliensis]